MRGDTVENATLLDIYGGLLTPKQREYAELYYFEDLSLSEIAELAGITAPGARDIIARAMRKIRNAEEKTGLAAKLETTRKHITEAIKIAGEMPQSAQSARLTELLKEVLHGI